MKFRKKLNKSYSKKLFSRTADMSHFKNQLPPVRRGGTRF